MKYPVKPVVLPADLIGVKPGMLPAYLLKPIRPYGQLHPLAAQAWEAMRKAAHADGIRPMKPTSMADTYRSLETQERGFMARYTTAPIATTSVRTYKGVKYYLKPAEVDAIISEPIPEPAPLPELKAMPKEVEAPAFEQMAE